MKAAVTILMMMTLLGTGCFTAAGAALGSRHEEPDGSTNMTTTIGYALAGALVDSALFSLWMLSALDDSSEDGSDFRLAPAPSPRSIPR